MVFRISTDDKDEKKQPINAQEMPSFTFQQQPLSASLGIVAINFGVLILFNIFFFVGAFISFLRYDVR